MAVIRWKAELVHAESVPSRTSRDRLARQRHAMWSLHLHGCGRHHPDGLLEIDLLPARKAQLAGPDEEQRRELERKPGRRLAAVAFDRP